MKPAAALLLLPLLAAPLGAARAQAQVPASAGSPPPVAWFKIAADQPLRGSWSVFTEVEARQATAQLPAQALGRLALRWHVGRSFSLSTGYVLARNQVPANPEITLPEHRFYQELALADATGPLRVAHRLRAEERWLRLAPGAGFSFAPRLRYQLRLLVPLHRAGRLPVGAAYLLAADEVFAGLGTQAQLLEENRLNLGLGYRCGPRTTLEVSYLWQTQAAGPARYEAAHRTAVQVSVAKSL